MFDELPKSEPREESAFYACVTITLKNEQLPEVYKNALRKFISGQKNSADEGKTYIDGCIIPQFDLDPEEEERVLEHVKQAFKEKGVIAFTGCYLDVLMPYGVNIGMYFNSKDQMQAFTDSWGEGLRINEIDHSIPYIASRNRTGRYQVGNSKYIWSGHKLSQKHLLPTDIGPLSK